jgi:DNA polymerase-3 subunit delta'
MPLSRILGHERVKGLLAGALRRGHVPQSLLFAGPDGVGKKALALAVGRALLCERGDGDACDECSTCSRGLRGLHPDLFLVEPATNAIKIDQVRDAVREIGGRPFEGKARAFVIDDAHVMTEQAMNALLKSLEEPPPTSHVFLVTAAPAALLPTIRSRCQVLRFGPLPAALVESHLRDVAGLDEAEAALRAAASGGSLGLALALESQAYKTVRELVLGLLERLASTGPLERMELAEGLQGVEDHEMALILLRSLLRDVAVLGVGGTGLHNPDLRPRLEALARGPLGGRAGRLAQAVAEGREALLGNANKLLTMDVLVEALAEA